MTAGIKANVDGSGAIQVGGTDVIGLSSGGSINIPTTGARITGDFSNATIANRVIFQTSTVNGATNIYAIPNGTGTTSGFTVVNNSDPTNAAIGQLAVTSTDIRIQASLTGTGSFLPMTFYTGGSERMRVDTSGNLLVNTATTSGSGKVTVLSSTSTTWNGIAVTAAAASGNGAYPSYEFYNNSNAYRGRIAYDLPNTRLHVENNSAGGVYLSSGATSWTANSDERLKTDLVPIENAAQKVSTLRAVTGRYITDEEGVSRAFLIAQDVQAVLPEAVDATDTEKLGVAYTDTIPLLVAAIKEQQQMIEELKAKVAALEGAA